MTVNGKVFVKQFVHNSKSNPYVDEVELINVNPAYADVCYPGGREPTVSIRELYSSLGSPCPPENSGTPNVSDV